MEEYGDYGIEDFDESSVDIPEKLSHVSMLTELHALNSYIDLNKGSLDKNCRVTSFCDTEYLDAIMSDLDLLEVVRWEEGVNDSEIIELWHTGLDKILEEVDRLTERPALIEVPEVRETFLRYIRNFCELFESDESVEPSGDLVEDINKTLYETHRSTYNEERVPWHQFLHQYAPGSNAKSMYQRECIDVGIRQMVPPAGLRLLCAWEQEYRDIEQLVNPTVEPDLSRGIAESAVHKERSLGGRIRYRLIGMIPGGPSCFEEKIKPEYQSLETLTKDLARWDVAVEEPFQVNPPPFMYITECTEPEWHCWKSQARFQESSAGKAMLQASIELMS